MRLAFSSTVKGREDRSYYLSFNVTFFHNARLMQKKWIFKVSFVFVFGGVEAGASSLKATRSPNKED